MDCNIFIFVAHIIPLVSWLCHWLPTKKLAWKWLFEISFLLLFGIKLFYNKVMLCGWNILVAPNNKLNTGNAHWKPRVMDQLPNLLAVKNCCHVSIVYILAIHGIALGTSSIVVLLNYQIGYINREICYVFDISMNLFQCECVLKSDFLSLLVFANKAINWIFRFYIIFFLQGRCRV